MELGDLGDLVPTAALAEETDRLGRERATRSFALVATSNQKAPR